MIKRGFTLIELIAVIVVLAVILAIAVPTITSVIRSSTMSAFESDTKLVLDTIRIKLLEDPNLDPTTIDETNISDKLGVSNENYEDLKIEVNNGMRYIDVDGKGKWAGFSACGTFFSIKVNEGACANDFYAPVITLLGTSPITIEVGSTYTDAGATATDDVDGNITNKIVVTETVNPNIVGTYVMSYDVSDNAGHNAVTLTRTVNVIDTTNPTITFGMNGNSTYAKTRSTTVTVSDAGGINASSLKYLWTTSTTPPTEVSFTTTFINGETITSPAGVTGGYYLWILAKDNQNNTIIASSNIFNLDNTIPVITITGSNPINMTEGSSYTDAGATAIDSNSGIAGVVSSTGTVNVNVVGTYYIYYNVSDNAGNVAIQVSRTINVVANYGGPGYIASKGANGPVLASGMTPVKWNGSAWVNTTISDSDWYNYTTADKKWANAMTTDGSMWVWIPRYIYKISSGWHSSTVGTINVQFSKGTDDNWNSSVIGGIDTGTTSSASNNKWTNHPAFTFGTTELTGIWVSKFEAGGTLSAVDSKPGVVALGSALVGDMFTAARNMETNSRYGWGTSGTGIDTHMSKNVEWGAIVYLTHSTYGKNAEVWMNNSQNFLTGCAGSTASPGYYYGCENAYNTTNGQQASSTGNIYGIYDISGGIGEYTAAYMNNSYASGSGASIVNAASQYKDVYTVTSDDTATNYTNASNKKGDAVYETSNNASGTTAWNQDITYMPVLNGGWFNRGGYSILQMWYSSSDNGIFAFMNFSGSQGSQLGFRVVLLVGTGL